MFTQSMGSGMLAHIELDQKFTTFTNLDTISGKVVIRLHKSMNITGITIKLEGESRTRLQPPPAVNQKTQRPQLEFHKILYKVITAFPPNGMLPPGGTSVYVMNPGEHHYPFTFKLPFNTACQTERSPLPSLSIQGLNVEFAQPPTQHLRRPLPPTLRGFPGEAEIRYYLKATVQRSGMFKENVRILKNFDFCPIEPPRPAVDGSEAFARKKHQFAQGSSISVKSSKWGRLTSKPKQEVPASPTGPAPLISVETRLPEPAILTTNQPVPLRILVTPLNDLTTGLYLSSLQLDLVGYTHVRAHNVIRTETNSMTLFTKSNLAIPITFDAKSSTFEVPPSLWNAVPVHESMCPSFETCNISRTYELCARIGVHHGDPRSNSQLVIFDLRQPTRLFSGIAPPAELLAALGKTGPAAAATTAPPPLPQRHAQDPNLPPAYTPAAGSAGSSVAPGPPSDAPPSYEDAVAERLPAAVHVGERRGYVPPPSAGEEDNLLPSDEKRRW